SDSLLAWDRFRGPLPLASLWVLSAYYLALWRIARSVQRVGTAIEAGAAQ
ncbi:lysoplasmalogenase, partial [Rhodanobacter denitrificans]|nr:lysoplasmalogenase [Rhodanobacter denitrificans]